MLTSTNVPEVVRSGDAGVTHPPPQPSPWPGPYPPSPPNQRPVDACHLTAEIEVRLAHQGAAPGPRYDRKAALRAVRALLAAMDIPESDDPLAVTRLVARRAASRAGAR